MGAVAYSPIFINSHQKFVTFMLNPIVENAMYHTNFEPEETNWIIVSQEDFKEVYHLIHPRCKPYVVQALMSMHHHGIDYAFWIEDNMIVFEG